ncbi:MAG: hypothetical protein MJ093_00005, partial [Saccharofermentans sp.]|nr:hypothetical protein [Saccharofermentans sp.]
VRFAGVRGAVGRGGGEAEFFEIKDDLKNRIDGLIGPGDIILILGPEDIRHMGDVLCPHA